MANKIKKPRINLSWLYIFIIGAIFLYYAFGEENSSVVKQEVYSNFTEYISKGYVESITVYDNDEVEAFIYKDSAKHVFSDKPIPANATHL